jgi:hypothetical protein
MLVVSKYVYVYINVYKSIMYILLSKDKQYIVHIVRG